MIYFDSDMSKSTNTVVYFDWKTSIYIYVCGICCTQFMLPNSILNSIFRYQLAIWEKNKKVIIPFCDTRLDHSMPGNPVATRLFTSKYFGNVNGPTVTGAFANWQTNEVDIMMSLVYLFCITLL
jgi:hypothetical protein